MLSLIYNFDLQFATKYTINLTAQNDNQFQMIFFKLKISIYLYIYDTHREINAK